MSERERNKRLLNLLVKLINDKDYDSIELIRTMLMKDTEAMQMSFTIMTREIYDKDHEDNIVEQMLKNNLGLNKSK